MRAGKFRGSPRRSPSSASKPSATQSDRTSLKPGTCRAFSFCALCTACISVIDTDVRRTSQAACETRLGNRSWKQVLERGLGKRFSKLALETRLGKILRLCQPRSVILLACCSATPETSLQLRKPQCDDGRRSAPATYNFAHRSFHGSSATTGLPCKTRLEKRCVDNHLST